MKTQTFKASKRNNSSFLLKETGVNSTLIRLGTLVEKRAFYKLAKEKLEIAKIRRKIITVEMETQKIRRKILEEELEHKNIIHELEKQHQLLKIELLKKELEKK